MIDPLIESHLFFLLTHASRERVTIEDVCWFHAGRALRVIREARLVSDTRGAFVPSDATAGWVTRMFKELRYVDTTHFDGSAKQPDYEPTAAAQKELPAPPPEAPPRSTHADPWGDAGEPTPTEPHRIAG